MSSKKLFLFAFLIIILSFFIFLKFQAKIFSPNKTDDQTININKSIFGYSYIYSNYDYENNKSELWQYKEGNSKEIFQIENGLITQTSLSPNKEKIAMIIDYAQGQGKTKENLIVYFLNQKNQKLIRESNSPIFIGNLVWSDDGARLFFDEAESVNIEKGNILPVDKNIIYQYSLETEKLEPLLSNSDIIEDRQIRISPLIFSSDNNQGLFITANWLYEPFRERLYRYNLGSQRLELVVNNDEGVMPFGFEDSFWLDSKHNQVYFISKNNFKILSLHDKREKSFIIDPETPSSISTPSPDGRWILYELNRQDLDTETDKVEVILLDLIDNEEQRIYLPQGLDFYKSAWTPDSKYLLFETMLQGIYRLNIVTKEYSRVSTTEFPLENMNDFIGFL